VKWIWYELQARSGKPIIINGVAMSSIGLVVLTSQ